MLISFSEKKEIVLKRKARKYKGIPYICTVL